MQRPPSSRRFWPSIGNWTTPRSTANSGRPLPEWTTGRHSHWRCILEPVRATDWDLDWDWETELAMGRSPCWTAFRSCSIPHRPAQEAQTSGARRGRRRVASYSAVLHLIRQGRTDGASRRIEVDHPTASQHRQSTCARRTFLQHVTCTRAASVHFRQRTHNIFAASCATRAERGVGCE